MKTLKNLSVLMFLLFSVSASATSLHPDTFVSPIFKVKTHEAQFSMYFEVRDHGTVRATIEDYQGEDDFIGIPPAKTEKKFYHLSVEEMNQVKEIAAGLRTATTVTERAQIVCMARPTPLYTEFLYVRATAYDSNKFIQLEHKIGPCARETTRLLKEKDLLLKKKLIKILKSGLKDSESEN